MIGYLSIQAQDVPSQAANNTDPKLSLEQGRPGPALSVNPAKPTTPLFDPKLNNELNSGFRESSSNPQKQAIVQLTDPKLEAEAISNRPKAIIPVIRTESKVPETYTKSSHEQPASEVKKNNLNYRNIKGPDSQPAATQPAKMTDYRKISGPNSQPAGEKPKR